MRAVRPIVRRRPALLAAGLALALVALAHPPALASDVWGNVGPASPLGIAWLDGRWPLGNYALDEHFTAISAGVFSGVDVSGVPPMIAYFLAEVIWQLTAFLANTLISLFGFAFSLDLVNGSEATGGAGALGPIASAIHSVYSNVFGAPWLVLGVAVAGAWAMWKALVQRRYAETAGSLALSVIYIVTALAFVLIPGQTIGQATRWTNEMSGAFLAIARSGSPGSQQQAKRAGADQLFSLLVFQPWSVLEFGGLEHCVKPGTGSADSDPVSAPVRPLSSDPSREAELSRRLAAGEEVSAEGKLCIDNTKKYSAHFLRFGPGTDERNAEYEALNEGDSSKLPEADPASSSYKLGVADKPATDAMEEGGQYQRLLVAVVVFVAELGAFCLLGALSVGVILAQVLLLLLLAFAPVALVVAAVPGRGHDFFKGWLAKLGGYLLRKAAYSLILAILLAVCAAIAAATSALGWLLSFGLQSLFFWAVLIQRRQLSESLIGIVTGPKAPGREGSLHVLALYYGARSVGRPLRGAGRSAASAAGGTASWFRGGGSSPTTPRAPRFGVYRSHHLGGEEPAGAGASAGESEVPREASLPPPAARRADASPSSNRASGEGNVPAARPRGEGGSARRAGAEPKPAKRPDPPAAKPGGRRKGEAPKMGSKAPPRSTPASERQGEGGESPLSAEPRSERERARRAAEQKRPAGTPKPPAGGTPGGTEPAVPPPPPRRKGRRPGKRGGKR